MLFQIVAGRYADLTAARQNLATTQAYATKAINEGAGFDGCHDAGNYYADKYYAGNATYYAGKVEYNRGNVTRKRQRSWLNHIEGHCFWSGTGRKGRLEWIECGYSPPSLGELVSIRR